jgi:hypothetical protein
MKHILLRSIAGSSLLLLSLTLTAGPQYSPRAGDRDRYYDLDQYSDRAQFFEHVRADLDRAESTASSFTADVERVNRVREDVGSFQRKLDNNYYDGRELTETIIAVQRVLDNNRLYDRTRDALVDDLNQLRNMRAKYEGWR